jgi:D-threo-aldose 1-dehydrogenase
LNSLIATRRVGRTALTVTELGLGTAPLGNLYEPVSDEDSAGACAAAFKFGIAYVDTAPYYGFGLSERRVGDALRGRDSIVVSTKVGRLLKPDPRIRGAHQRHGYCSPMPFEPVYDYSFDAVMASWEASLQRLGLARIEILYIHDIGRLTHGDQNAVHFQQLTQGGGFRALEQLRSAGAIHAFGLGVNEIAVCLEAMNHAQLDIILLAGRYTLLEQDALHALLPACQRSGTSIVIGGPYNSGILATGTRHGGALYYNYGTAPHAIVDRVQRLESICDRFGIPLAAAALQFPLAHPQVASVIPGLRSAHHVELTAKLYGTMIPAPFWQELKRAGLLHADAPIPAGTAANP